MTQLLATAASVAIGNARRWRRARAQVEQLTTALASRAVIEQAKGVLMATHGIGADEAFARLADISHRTSTPECTAAAPSSATGRRPAHRYRGSAVSAEIDSLQWVEAEVLRWFPAAERPGLRPRCAEKRCTPWVRPFGIVAGPASASAAPTSGGRPANGGDQTRSTGALGR